jgi:hypothetical protein
VRLNDADRDLFYRLLWHLLFYASQQLEFLPRVASPEALSQLDEETWRRLRDSLYEHSALFDSFVATNPFHFTDEELAIVATWKGFLRGEFYVWRYLRKYTVFISGKEPERAYGVVAPNRPFEMMLGPHLPVAIEAVLLPFKDKIVYDGLFASYPVSFGPGIRRMLREVYARAKARDGIITSFAQLSALTRAEPGDAARDEKSTEFALRYWHGFTQRLPYRLESLKLVTDADIRTNRLESVVASATKERVLLLPEHMGMKVGFSPIQVEVLELTMDGRTARIEVLNRGGSLFLIRNPSDIRRFHRFIHTLETALPASRQPLL